MRSPGFALALAVLVGAATAGCATPAPVVGRAPGGAEIVQIELSISNVFLVNSKRPVLVDAGSEGDLDDLEEALAAHGLALGDIALVIVTHGHADHAGQAGLLRARSGAKVALGAGDLPLARAGRNDAMQPMSFSARLLRLVLSKTYPPFEPDLVVSAGAPLDLGPWGIEGRAVHMPGHTDGSLVVLLGDRAAFVGDQVLGGSLGGSLCPESPNEHYFHADPAQNRQNIEALVNGGVETFDLGHGGPVARADVIDAFEID